MPTSMKTAHVRQDHEQKERVRIAKGKRRVGRVQFNALAIILLLGVYPFAIGFIVNAGSSTDGAYHDAYDEESNGVGIWYENGGKNMTNAYLGQGLPQDFLDKCFIEDGTGNKSATITPRSYLTYDGNSLNADYFIPYKEALMKQGHYYCGTNYVGDSGTGPYSWYFPEIEDQVIAADNNFLTGITQNETVDKLKFSFVDRFVFLNCLNPDFTDITYDGEISFYYQNRTKTFQNFKFESTNKYEYNAWDQQNSHWEIKCAVGFEVEFDFTGFESLALTEFNGGDWERTGFKITLDDFEREDGLNFGNTPLPFNGIDFFSFGAEYQSINTVTAGFIIKSGTFFLSIITFALAIASTPYWNPLMKQIKGGVV